MKLMICSILSCFMVSIVFAGPNLKSKKLSLVTFNVENLFDSEHTIENGRHKNDWQFLPKNFPGKQKQCEKIENESYRQKCFESDWTKDKVALKFKQIKLALTSSLHQLPDLLALIEVENENVASKLAHYLGYKQLFITKSLDPRGIDVALLIKPDARGHSLRVVEVLRHNVNSHKLFKDKPTRDILEVIFKLQNNHTFSLFINHWPSQSNPSQARMVVAKKLKQIIKKRNHHIIVTGDFNVVDSDYPHALKSVVQSGRRPLLDVHSEFMNSKEIEKDLKKNFPLGTYFYAPKMQWDLLDRFFISKSLLDNKGPEVELESYRVLTKGISKDRFYDKGSALEHHFHFGSTVTNAPWPYDHQEMTPDKLGFSDHFPIFINLTY